MGARSVLATALLVVAVPQAHAATLYRCVSPGGAVAIQQRDCGAGWTRTWRREVTPEPEPAAAPRRSGPAPKPARPATPAPRRGMSERAKRKRRCAAARAEAQRRREVDWMDLRFDERRRLDDRVWRECR